MDLKQEILDAAVASYGVFLATPAGVVVLSPLTLQPMGEIPLEGVRRVSTASDRPMLGALLPAKPPKSGTEFVSIDLLTGRKTSLASSDLIKSTMAKTGKVSCPYDFLDVQMCECGTKALLIGGPLARFRLGKDGWQMEEVATESPIDGQNLFTDVLSLIHISRVPPSWPRP